MVPFALLLSNAAFKAVYCAQAVTTAVLCSGAFRPRQEPVIITPHHLSACLPTYRALAKATSNQISAPCTASHTLNNAPRLTLGGSR